MSLEKECRWHFADQTGGREDGPNDAVTQNLKGGLYSTLIREAFQNALDAAQGPASEKGPVRVEISFGSINGIDFPNYNELGAHIKGCIDCFPDNDQARSIYEPMLESFSSSSHYDMKVDYIKIADFNTNGMDYVPSSDPEYRKKPFYAFVRSVGVHANDSDGSGGSYGFGKAAYFLISPLKTLMVSTMTNSGKFYFEGVSSLCTHTFEGKTKVSVGFYDNNGGNPINTAERIPKPFRRTEPGTNFYLMGVRLTEQQRTDAVKEMLEASVRNFWMSILDGSLVVSIDGHEINKNNLPDHMTAFFPSVLDDVKTALRHNPRPYYEAFTHANEDNNHKHFEKNIPILGMVHFYAYLNPQASDRIIFMRGLRMFVYRKKSQTNAAFFGLFLCYDPRGNLILRDMEPPRHDDWDPDCARKYTREECRKAKDEYVTFISECIKQLHPEDADKGIEVLGADEVYVPESLIDEGESNGIDSNTGQSGNSGQPSGKYQDNGTSMTTDISNPDNNTNPTESSNKGKVRRIDKGRFSDDGSSDGRFRKRGKDKKKRKGRGRQPGNDGTGRVRPDPTQHIKNLVEVSLRVVCTIQENHLYHDLIIRSEEDVENGELVVIIGGEDSQSIIPIIESSEGSITRNCITGIRFKANEKKIIRVRFEDNMRHAIKLEAYERN